MSSDTDDATLSLADLERHGLTGQPFVENGFYFADEAIEATLNLALNIIQNTGRVLIVAGPPGVGRSAFLRELAVRSGELVCSGVRGGPKADIRRLLSGLRAEGPTSVLEQLRHSGQRHALLVDDADRLPRPVFEQLLDCHEAVTIEGVEWPLVLCCETETLPDIEQALVAHGYDEDLTQTLHLLALTPIQTAAYTQARLQAVGDAGASLISERDLKRIHQRSGGVPAAIHREAAKILAGAESTKPPVMAAFMERVAPLRLPGRSSVTFLVLVAAVASIVIGVLISLWLHEEEVARESEPLTLVPEEAPVAAVPEATEDSRSSDIAAESGLVGEDVSDQTGAETPGESTGEPDTVSPPEPMDAPVSGNAPPEDAGAVAAEGSTTDGETPEVGDATTPDALPEPDNELDSDADPQPEAVPRPEPERGSEPTDDPQSAADTGSEERTAGATEDLDDTAASAQESTSPSRDWIEQRSDNRYTIQLIGGRERGTVERFFEEVGRDERLHVIESRRDGSRWLVVVTGDYPSSEAARAGMDSLPEAWRQYGAFPRSFGSLRD